MAMEPGVIDLYERAVRLAPEQIADLLRSGMCPSDRSFDRYLPSDLQALSNSYWTPLVTARRAAQWLDEVGVGTVIDIGSGAGKFCVATALASSCSFVGIEHRARLVTAARELAETFDVQDRVRFVEGALGDVELPEADAIYLFNPFGENLYGPEDSIDRDVELSDARYDSDVTLVERALHGAKVGSFLLTYNGFGGRVPWYYQEVRVDRELPSVLRMWRKTRRPGEI